ncbi:MAG TPA: alpha/beta hydrolase [Verrucomicrobiae bacterium]
MASNYPNPVIFVPGIMGSALRDQYPVSPETVWSPFKLLIKSYERVTTHPSDPRFELQEPARVVADHVFELIYSDFIEELRHNLASKADEPIPVYPFAYDWRQPLENTEAQLGELIDEVIARTRLLRHYAGAGFGTARFPGQVNLAGHSMGGLIIAGYLQKNGQKKVNRVATLGSPFRGSLEAVAKTAVGIAALGGSPGSSREREAARVTPALYYLLPSFRGAVAAEPGLADDLFLPQAWQPGILRTLQEFIRMYGVNPGSPERQASDLLRKMLDAAWRYRTRTEKLQLDNPKDWLCVAGVDAPTRVHMHIGKDAAGQPRFDLTDADVKNEYKNPDPNQRVETGDHTVPYLGSRAKFIPAQQVVCVTPADFSFWEFKDRVLEATGFHSMLPSLNLAQRLVVSHFRGRLYGDVWGRPAPDLDPGAAWDPPIAGLPAR